MKKPQPINNFFRDAQTCAARGAIVIIDSQVGCPGNDRDSVCASVAIPRISVMKQRTIFIRSIIKTAFSFALLVALFSSAATEGRAQGAPTNRKGEVVVELKPEASIEAVNARHRTSVILKIYGTNFYRLAVPAGKKEKKWRKRLAKDSDILTAMLNPVVTNPVNVFARSIINFPDDRATPGQLPDRYTSQLDFLNLSEAQLRSRGRGVVVAVIDTGVDRNHAALASKLYVDANDGENNGVDDDADGLVDDARGWDFVDNDNDPHEGFADPQTTVAGHGTFITGLILLVAPEAQILPVRAFNPEGISDAFTVAASIKYAADHGANVINLSLGSPENSSVLHDAIVYARQRGAVVIAAAGNNNENIDSAPQFPASWPAEAMGVAAVDVTGKKAVFSNFGANVAVSAPGVGLVSTFPGGASGDYALWSGTSFAAPLASGEAALILGAVPRHPDTRGTIEATAVSIDGVNPDFSGRLGRGRINPLGALQSLEPVSNIHAQITLQSTDVEPLANGKAEFAITGTEQEFELEAIGLAVNRPYRIVVDGNQIIHGGRATSNNFGGLKIEFSTTPSDNHEQLPGSLNPVRNIRHVELRDSQDRVILQGDFGQPTGGVGSAGESLEKETKLNSTGIVADARGDARVEIEPEREELRVRAEKLVPGAVYQIVVDGTNIGSATAQGSSGFFRLEFTTDGSGDRLLPSALRPVTGINRIEVRNQANQVVLTGDFQPGGASGGDDDSGGGGDDDGDDDGDDGDGGDDGGGNSGGGGQDKEATFTRTGVDPNANGEVKLKVAENSEEMEIRAEDLDPRAEYEIVIDGFSLGLFSADDDGEIRRRWGTDPDEMPLPPQIRPLANIRRIEIRTESGTVVLFASLAP